MSTIFPTFSKAARTSQFIRVLSPISEKSTGWEGRGGIIVVKDSVNRSLNGRRKTYITSFALCLETVPVPGKAAHKSLWDGSACKDGCHLTTLDWSLGFTWWKEGTDSPKLSSDLHFRMVAYVDINTHTHTHTI